MFELIETIFFTGVIFALGAMVLIVCALPVIVALELCLKFIKRKDPVKDDLNGEDYGC